VVARFGADILNDRGALDRQRLGAIVFADAAARRDLEAIVHPFVREATERWYASLDPARHRFALADIPLLYEVGREVDYEAVIVTACDPATQLKRLMDRDSLSESAARQRIAAQLPLEEKVRRATYVIWTDGSYVETANQVREIFARLVVSG
jgi:dephospho-CoA kinase